MKFKARFHAADLFATASRSMGFFGRGLHTIATVVLVFATLWALYYLPSTMAFLDPVAKALGDIELSDLVFSQLRDDAASGADTNIVLVNIGALNRAGIAAQIRRIAAEEPRVIGIDAIFRTPKDAEGDAALAEALTLLPRITLVSKLADYDADAEVFNTKETSHQMFQTYAGTGFANMLAAGDDNAGENAQPTDMIREFSPAETVRIEGETEKKEMRKEWAFAVKTAWFFDSTAVQRLLARENPSEIINYRGNYDKFYTLDVEDVLGDNTQLSFVRGKIVIFGFFGATFGKPSLEDMFFTPMNKRYAGRAFPDMYGACIHANIVSMILSGDYVETLPDALEYAIAAVLCLLNIVILTFLYYRRPFWYDALSLLMQFTQSVLILIIFTVAFHWFRLKIEATLLVAVIALTPIVHELYHIALYRFSLKKSLKNAEGEANALPLIDSPPRY
jgi:CHASE2 domain-containing sensor protein